MVPCIRRGLFATCVGWLLAGSVVAQTPPDEKLDAETIQLLENWVRSGASGPLQDRGETDFSRLGDQPSVFAKAADHWAFQRATNWL